MDLQVHGLSRYASDPSTDVLCLAFAIDDGPAQVWLRGVSEPPTFPDDAEIVAHHAQFELAIWNNVMVRRYGRPPLDPARVVCTMARSYAMGLPGALENAAPALGLKVKKDMEGRALMLRMCKPRPDGTWIEDAASMQRLGEYCAQDVEVEREIFKRTFALSPTERELWQLDYKINTRGIPFDVPTAKGMLTLMDAEKERLNLRMAETTGGEVATVTNVGSLKTWAADYGVMPDSLAKSFLNELLEADLPAPVEQALRLRQEASRFTSIAKVQSIIDREVLGRVQYAFAYHAASTGRWAGRGVQPHNFTRDLPDPETVETVLAAVRDNNPAVIDVFGQVSVMLSRCLRALVKAEQGYELLAGDYSAIEGRGTAWLAGEQWKLDAFASDSDVYVDTYARSFGVTAKDVTKEQRQIGKVMELAFGYQGGVGAFHSMAKNYGVKASDALADGFKRAWRLTHPRVEAMWAAYQRAAISAARSPAPVSTNRVTFVRKGNFLLCRLPSSRVLTYPYPQLRQDDFGPYLTYKRVPDPLAWATYRSQKEEGLTNTTKIVDDESNCKQWARIRTYGGMLTENVTQAICRDILAEAMQRIDAAGMAIVLHVHDEIVTQNDPKHFETFKKLMCVQPDWAEGFPVAAKCWHANRYKKDD